MRELTEMLNHIRKELQMLYENDWNDEEREKRERAGDDLDLWDYFNDVLDIEYRVDSRGEYKGAYIWITLGGPNVHIDTWEKCIKGAWGSDRAEVWLPYEICDAIDEIFEEYFNNCLG